MFYEKLPTELLVNFYYEINKNIEAGLLSEAMYHELSLIKKAARKRGILLDNLFRHDPNWRKNIRR